MRNFVKIFLKNFCLSIRCVIYSHNNEKVILLNVKIFKRPSKTIKFSKSWVGS